MHTPAKNTSYFGTLVILMDLILNSPHINCYLCTLFVTQNKHPTWQQTLWYIYNGPKRNLPEV
ncbi:hypothetical protein LPBF_06790 [Flavobacterium crassostreae]|uniref:Uncharacterized protein n=1 Tax=Flavobacterium crassostreae TaxID=1763534 RepID=A0A1B9E3W4_9FLAO|nr:hypothetical protein LPBF_06790 [Flavobacterium crassostreae]